MNTGDGRRPDGATSVRTSGQESQWPRRVTPVWAGAPRHLRAPARWRGQQGPCHAQRPRLHAGDRRRPARTSAAGAIGPARACLEARAPDRNEPKPPCGGIHTMHLRPFFGVRIRCRRGVSFECRLTSSDSSETGPPSVTRIVRDSFTCPDAPRHGVGPCCEGCNEGEGSRVHPRPRQPEYVYPSAGSTSWSTAIPLRSSRLTRPPPRGISHRGRPRRPRRRPKRNAVTCGNASPAAVGGFTELAPGAFRNRARG